MAQNMISRYHFSLLLCAGLFCLGLNLFAQDPAKGSLQGVVTMSRTGEPLVGARVSLSSAVVQTPPSRQVVPTPLASTSTDQNGHFILAAIEPGAYRFSVVNNGYVRYESAR